MRGFFMRKNMTQKTAFVLMPFKEDLKEVYDFLISDSLSQAGYKPTRADDIKSQSNILEDIIQSIAHSDLIVADLTGANANVYYELGIAHALQRKVILMTQEISELPFDLRSYRVISYSTHFSKMNQAKKELYDLAIEAYENKLPFGNPVKDYIKSRHNVIEIDDYDPPAGDLGLLDLQILLEESFEKLKDIVDSVGERLALEVTPKINESTEQLINTKLKSTEKRIIVQSLAEQLQSYASFIKPQNKIYANLLKNIETALEAMISGEFEPHDADDINLTVFLDSLSSLEDSAEEGKRGFMSLIRSMENLPKIEKSFDRANSFMATELKNFVDNIDKTVAVAYRAKRLGSNLAKNKADQ